MSGVLTVSIQVGGTARLSENPDRFDADSNGCLYWPDMKLFLHGTRDDFRRFAGQIEEACRQSAGASADAASVDFEAGPLQVTEPEKAPAQPGQ